MKLNNDIELLQGDCAHLLPNIASSSVDAIITDPPYLYLDRKEHNSEFDEPFDEGLIFSEYYRVLKPTGFVLIFGRGLSFYRWGTSLADLGFAFKEEIVWDKKKHSSPFLALGRRHESIAVFAKNAKKGTIKPQKIPYVEFIKGLPLKERLEKIERGISRLLATFNNVAVFEDLKDYVKTGIMVNRIIHPTGNNVTINRDGLPSPYREIHYMQEFLKGKREEDIIRLAEEDEIPDFIVESSFKNKYHPTQKPTRLLERLIALTTNEGDLVLDSFMGGGSTGEACLNSKRRFIGIEKCEKYFEIAKERLQKKIEDLTKEKKAVGNELF